MENLFRIQEFLSNRCIIDYCEMSFIFGSIAKGNKYPNDCDLFWVTNCHPETVTWEKMREYVQLMKSDFYNEFELKLNVTINTLNEFKEKSDFKQTNNKNKKRHTTFCISNGRRCGKYQGF